MKIVQSQDMRKLFKMIESNSSGHLTSIILILFSIQFPSSPIPHLWPESLALCGWLLVAKGPNTRPAKPPYMGSKSANCLISEFERRCVFSLKKSVPSTRKKTCLVWTFRLFCPKIGGYIDIHGFHLIWRVSMSFPCDFPMLVFSGKKHHHVSAGYSSDTQRPCELCFAMATKIRYSKTVGWIGCRNSMILLHGCWDFLDFRYSNMYWNLHQNMGVESCSHDEWCLQICLNGWCIKQN